MAGKCWLAGDSPYQREVFFDRWENLTGTPRRAQFAYPPSTVVIAVPLALLDWSVARFTLDFGNVFSLFLILFLLSRSAIDCGVSTRRIAIACIIAGSTASNAMVLTLGQLTLIAVGGLTLADFCIRRNHHILAGVGIALAAFKLHVTGICLLYLAVRRGWKAPVIGAGLVIVAALVGIGGNITEFMSRYSSCLAEYRVASANQPQALVGLPRLLQALGIQRPTLIGALLGLLMASLCLYLRLRDPVFPESPTAAKAGNTRSCTDSLGPPAAITAAFVPLHIYDLVLLVPMVFATISSPLRRLLVFLPGLICVLRPTNVARILTQVHNMHPQEAAGWVATAGSLYLLVVVLISARRDTGAQTPGDALL
ncbi:MAG: DUF2029 domain-containing protein [Phycisphaerae bacterium]|nr:DUF2029 domain-containing protein [Phycisphaerae bacterium]